MASSDADSRKEVAKYEALAETAYNAMYDARSPAACYSDLKDYFAMAIGAAERAAQMNEQLRDIHEHEEPIAGDARRVAAVGAKQDWVSFAFGTLA